MHCFKGHCNGLMQLFTWSISDRPEHHVRPFTLTHRHTHAHTAFGTPTGMTSLRWLTFHQEEGETKRYFPSPSCPHVCSILNYISALFFLCLPATTVWILSLSVCPCEQNYASLSVFSISVLFFLIKQPCIMCLCMCLMHVKEWWAIH